MWILISKAIFTNSGNISQFNASTTADYTKALWYNQETGEVQSATTGSGEPITNIENYLQRVEEGETVRQGGTGSLDRPGPTLEGGATVNVPREMTPTELEEAFKEFYSDPDFVKPTGYYIDPDSNELVYDPDVAIQIGGGSLADLGPGVPIPEIDPDDIIAGRLATQGFKQFLGFDVPGTPLGYKGAGEGYGDNPVYTSELVTTLFMDDMYGEDFIRSLQRKLVGAGYLIGGFEPGSMDLQTQSAITAAMSEHNLEGRVPYFDDGFLIEGALLALQTTTVYDEDGNPYQAVMDPSNPNVPLLSGDEVEQYQSKFAFTPKRKQQIVDFFFNELDNDVADLDQRLIDNYSVVIPKYDSETAGYIAYDAVKNYFGGAEKISYTEASSLAGIVNKLVEVTKRDFDKTVITNIKDDITAEIARLDYDQFIDTYGGVEGYKDSLKKQYPFADDVMLDQLVRNRLKSYEVTTGAEVGPAAWQGGTQDPTQVTGAGERFNSMFNARLNRTVDKLYGEEKDLVARQSLFDNATAAFFQSAQGLRNLGRNV